MIIDEEIEPLLQIATLLIVALKVFTIPNKKH